MNVILATMIIFEYRNSNANFLIEVFVMKSA